MKKKAKKHLHYAGFVPKNFPPGWYDAQVTKIVKAKGKNQLIVTVQVKKRIDL